MENVPCDNVQAARYDDCKSEYNTIEHGKICPNCGSEHTYLLKGNEFMIKEIAAT